MRGVLSPGEQLPSLRMLSAHLGISIPTLREAFQALAFSGLIELRHGRGCFVARRPGAARTLAVNFHRSSQRDLSALRAMIEPTASRLAAGRQDARLAAKLRLLAGERARLAGFPYAEEFTAADAAFHRAMVNGSRVSVAIDLHRRAMDQLHDAGLGHAADLAEDGDLEELHYLLAEAVERGDPEAAGKISLELVAIETGTPRPAP